MTCTAKRVLALRSLLCLILTLLLIALALLIVAVPSP
jgi:hypothetical protein